MGLGDPRVIWKLYDLSIYINEIQKGWITVLIQAERGPMWEPRAISDPEHFIEEFGNSVDWTTDPFYCIEALKAGAKLIVYRIGHCSNVADRSTLMVLPASTLLEDRGGQPTHGYIEGTTGPFTLQQPVSGRGTGEELGPYLFVLDTNDKFKCKVGVAGAWGPDQTVTFTAGEKTAQVTCDALNAGTDGINFTVVGNKVHFEAIDPGHDVEILAITHDAYSTLGINEGAFAHIPGTTGLVIAIDAGADQPFTLAPAHGETGQFSLTSAEVATQLAGLTGATVSGSGGKAKVTSSTTGTGSKVQIKDTSTADTALGFDNDVHAGIAGVVKHPWKYLLNGPGAYGNDAKIYIYDSPLNPGERINVRVTIPGAPEQYFKELSNDSDDPKYWKAYINAHDRYGKIVDADDDPNPSPYNWPAVTSADGLTLAGGDDGVTVLTDADYVGDSLARTGYYCTDRFLIPSIDIMAFGTTSAVAYDALITFVSDRSGRMGHGACPDGLGAQDVIDWRMGNPPDYSHAAFDSPNFSIIFGNGEAFDSRNNERRPINGLPYLAAAIGRTDEAYGPHISPFGVKRGRCPGLLTLEENVAEDRASADVLAEYGINSMRILRTTLETRGWEGSVLWGGWTSQRIDSALKEFPVVRLIKQYEWMLIPVMLGWINDPNHPVTWAEVHRVLEPVFRRDLNRYAIYGYFIQTDRDAFFAGGELKGAYLNTPDDIDQGKYRCRILIKPLRQIFYFIAEMGIMRTGDPFTDYSTMYELPGWVRGIGG